MSKVQFSEVAHDLYVMLTAIPQKNWEDSATKALSAAYALGIEAGMNKARDIMFTVPFEQFKTDDAATATVSAIYDAISVALANQARGK